MAFTHFSIYDIEDDSQLNRIRLRQTIIELAILKHYIPIDKVHKALHVNMFTRESSSLTAEMAFTQSGIYDIEDDSQSNRISLRLTAIERALFKYYIPIE